MLILLIGSNRILKYIGKQVPKENKKVPKILECTKNVKNYPKIKKSNQKRQEYQK